MYSTAWTQHQRYENHQEITISKVFRPPFINGRPQDSVSVFWRTFLLSSSSLFFQTIVKSPLFSFALFLKRSYQGSPGVTKGVTRDHQGSPREVPLGSLGSLGSLFSDLSHFMMWKNGMETFLIISMQKI